MPWHPPIPSDAVYSSEVAQLGSGLRLLWYLYNGVQRDCTVEYSPRVAARALGVPYETLRNWWQDLRPLGIVSVVQDKGKNGYLLRFGDEWLDWHVMAANYGDVQRSNMPVETQEKPASTEFQRSNMPVEDPAYKVLMDDQDSPPPPPTQPPRANAAGAAGGGGGGAARAGEPTDPVWRLFTNTRYGILNADLLMPQWAGQDADAVAQLLERLYKKHHDPTNPQHTGGRLYRALKAGPAVLFAPAQAPPARAAPAPPARAAPVNVRQIAAILSEGRAKGRANGYQSPDSDKLPDDPGRRTGPAREPRS